MNFSQVIVWILCYLIGSFPTAYVIGQYAYRMDIREHGSGNVGSTNTLRLFGWRFALLTFSVDFFKGFMAVYLASYMLSIDILSLGSMLAGICAFIGHLYPIYIGFRGGKGAAVASGVLFALNPWDMIGVMFIFGIVLSLCRYVSLSTIVASLSLSGMASVRFFIYRTESLYLYLFFCVFISFFIVLMHRSNIKRLYRGEEPRLQLPLKG